MGLGANTRPDWVRGNAVPLRAVQTGSGFHDLQLLKEIVSDVDVLLFVDKTNRRPP